MKCALSHVIPRVGEGSLFPASCPGPAVSPVPRRQTLTPPPLCPISGFAHPPLLTTYNHHPGKEGNTMAAPYRQTDMPRPLPGCEQPTLTSHACTRAGQRSFSRAEIEYVLTHGRVIRRTGIRFYFLAARDVPLPDRRSAWVQRL